MRSIIFIVTIWSLLASSVQASNHPLNFFVENKDSVAGYLTEEQQESISNRVIAGIIFMARESFYENMNVNNYSLLGQSDLEDLGMTVDIVLLGDQVVVLLEDDFIYLIESLDDKNLERCCGPRMTDGHRPRGYSRDEHIRNQARNSYNDVKNESLRRDYNHARDVARDGVSTGVGVGVATKSPKAGIIAGVGAAVTTTFKKVFDW